MKNYSLNPHELLFSSLKDSYRTPNLAPNWELFSYLCIAICEKLGIIVLDIHNFVNKNNEVFPTHNLVSINM